MQLSFEEEEDRTEQVVDESAPLAARYGLSPISLKPFVICLSSSSRSVIITAIEQVL